MVHAKGSAGRRAGFLSVSSRHESREEKEGRGSEEEEYGGGGKKTKGTKGAVGRVTGRAREIR